MIGANRQFVDVSVRGICLVEGEFKRTFVPMRSVRKVQTHVTPADMNDVRIYSVHIIYGEDPLDVFNVICSSEAEANDLYESVLQKL